MPELPDVEVITQYINATGLHTKINQIEINDKSVLEVSPRTLRKYVLSQSLEKTKRAGKYIFVLASSKKWLVLHFGMTGTIDYSEGGSDIPEHTRLLFHFDNGGRLSYVCQRKLGSVDISDSPSQFSQSHDLGDDALAVNLNSFRKLLKNKRGMIKSALMDQSTIAGIGNVYSDEILYQCKIHPRTKVSALSKDQLTQLHQSMQRILQTAINNQANADQMPAHYLISHREKGAECPDCNGKVERLEISGRGCYICPNCQTRQ